MAYHRFIAEDGVEYGSFEVFHSDDYGPHEQAGRYWWPCLPGCLPGCLPSSDIPFGPFATEQEAIDDARNE